MLHNNVMSSMWSTWDTCGVSPIILISGKIGMGSYGVNPGQA